MRLAGKVAIVTGASRGIGKGIAIILAKEGAAVVIAARSESAGRVPGTIHETARYIEKAGGRALAVRCDVTSEEDVHGMVLKTVNEFGRIDLLVNNAGGSSTFGPISNFPLHRFDRVVALNLRGTFLCSKAVLPQMVKQESGVIVNITSDSAQGFAFPDDAIYGMVKAGVERFTLGLGSEVKEQGISIVGLWPAKVKTEGAEAIHGAAFDWADWWTPEEIGPAVVWLARQTPRTCTMQILDIREFGTTWAVEEKHMESLS